MATSTGLMVEFRARTVEIDAAFKRVRDQATALEHQLKDMNKNLAVSGSSASSAFSTLRGILGTLGVYKVAQGLEDLVTSASDLHDKVEGLGLSIGGFQRLAIAAGEAGVSQDTLSTALFKLNVILGQAQLKIPEAEKKLALLGFTAKDFAGLETDKSLLKIVHAAAKIGDATVRADVLKEFLGKGAKDFLPAVNTELEKTVANLEKLHVGLETIQGNALDRLADKSKSTWEQMKIQAQGALGDTVLIAERRYGQIQKIIETVKLNYATSNDFNAAFKSDRGESSLKSSIPGYLDNAKVDNTAEVRARLGMKNAGELAAKSLSEMAKASNGALIAFNTFKNAYESAAKGASARLIAEAGDMAGPKKIYATDGEIERERKRLYADEHYTQGHWDGPNTQELNPNFSSSQAEEQLQKFIKDPTGIERAFEDALTRAYQNHDTTELKQFPRFQGSDEAIKLLESQLKNQEDTNRLIEELKNLQKDPRVGGESQKSIETLLGSINENTDPKDLLKSVDTLTSGLDKIIAKPAEVEIRVTVAPSADFNTKAEVMNRKQLDQYISDFARQQGRR